MQRAPEETDERENEDRQPQGFVQRVDRLARRRVVRHLHHRPGNRQHRDHQGGDEPMQHLRRGGVAMAGGGNRCTGARVGEGRARLIVHPSNSSLP
jgi:hypothetical protein